MPSWLNYNNDDNSAKEQTSSILEVLQKEQLRSNKRLREAKEKGKKQTNNK